MIDFKVLFLSFIIVLIICCVILVIDKIIEERPWEFFIGSLFIVSFFMVVYGVYSILKLMGI